VTDADRRFRRVALFVYAYILLVIVGGAVVRITGSGAGCGQHWPTCHGEIVPTAPSLETAIEYTHRLTSGLSLLAVVWLVVAARRTYAAGSAVRSGAWATALFIVTESLIGAGIVLLEYVAENQSYARAAWMGVHLVNTFLLAGALVWTAWAAGRPADSRPLPPRGERLELLGLVGVLVVLGISGAIAALGNTLFPVDPALSPIDRVLNDPWADTPYPMLVRLVHPALSLVATLWLGAVGVRFAASEQPPGVRRAARWYLGALALQVAGGFVNIALSAPGWMQVLHLAMAQALWAALLVLIFEIAAARRAPFGASAPAL
jgi:cytochrome c oxidase assembly protein subunit 15